MIAALEACLDTFVNRLGAYVHFFHSRLRALLAELFNCASLIKGAYILPPQILIVLFFTLLLIEYTYLPQIFIYNVTSCTITYRTIRIWRAVSPTTYTVRVICRKPSIRARGAVPQREVQSHVQRLMPKFVDMWGHVVSELSHLLLLGADPHGELDVVFELLEFEGELHGNVLLVAVGVG